MKEEVEFNMTQEEKLLLRDLCARLTYGTIVSVTDGAIKYKTYIESVIYKYLQVSPVSDSNFTAYTSYKIDEIKPYLRPMSSMTEEESNELESITFPLMEKDWDGNENPACIRWIDIPKYMDFILSHHFDYQGLIEKGLAIEVTKENNPYKD